MPAEFAHCTVCGNPVDASRSTGQCVFCLLQLGLSSSLSLGATDESADASDFFLRQGVLPVFDDYVLESEIARGGMGVVYRARQISLDRPVAIKMILAGQLASPELIQRFRVEAQSASRLRHPGIIQIYEIGEWETQHYFSMELVDGASLAHCMGDIQLKERARARERRRQENTIARLIAQVAQALDYAHKRGVLHRDVKPSNILIDERGNPRLTDFGLAKLIGHGAVSNTKVFGTPSYAAPEQATAAEDELTTAADVYALGATLYHLLTGRPPHAADSVLAPLRCAGEQPPVSPRRWTPRLHRDLESIAMRCLAIKPQDRYHSAEAVAEDLERFIQGKAITARSIGPTEWAIKWCRRNSALAASLMVLAAAVVVGVGVAVWQWRQVRTANVRLTTTVADLQWNSINEMVRHGHASTALAKVASIIRQNPREPGPAMFAMSLFEQRRIPLKAAPQIRHPNGAALSVARMSPDGRRIATASFDGTVRIWDALSSVQLVPPLQHESAVNWIEFSPDGRAIASCAQDKAVRFWDAQTGSLLAAIKLPVHAAQRVQYSADGKHLLAETDDSVFLFDAATRQLATNPIVQRGRMIAAKFLDGQRLCVVSSDEHRAVIGVWELLAGTLQSSMQVEPLRRADLNLAADRVVGVGNDGRAFVEDFPTGLHRREIAKDQIVQRVLFDASGTRIAALGLGQWARVFSSDNGQALTDELPHYYVLNGAAFIDDGQKLLTWGSDSLAQLWDVEQNRMDCEPMRHADRLIYAEAARVGGRQFFLTTQTHSRAHSITEQSVDAGSGAAQLWSVDDRHNPQDRLFSQLYPGFDATRLSPDGRWVAFGTTENASGLEEIRLLNVSDGTAVCPHMVVKGGAWGLMFSPDGSRLVSTTSIGQVTVWGLPRGVAVSSPVMLPSGIHPAEMSADGSRFATGSNDGSVRIWETASAKPVLLMQHGAALHSLAFSPDGTLLASAGADHITRLWNSRTGAQVRALVGHTNEVMTVFFSPDGNKLVTGSFDFTARVWDTATGRTLAVLPHQGEVLDVAFSPDSKRIATGSRDCTAVIWDASSGQALVRTAPFDAAVRNVRFSPDGTRLITLDFHGVQVWDCASGHPLTVHMAHEMDGGTGFQDSALRFDLSSDGQTILLGADSPTEQLWHLPHPPAPTPLWFADLLESAAGERLTQTADVHQTATFNRPLEFPGELINPHSTDYYTAWARQWLSAQASPAASPVTSPGAE